MFGTLRDSKASEAGQCRLASLLSSTPAEAAREQTTEDVPVAGEDRDFILFKAVFDRTIVEGCF